METITPCDTCGNRQRNLDPEGCFYQVSTTGFFGSLWVWLMGCERRKPLAYWRVDAGRNR